MVEPARRRRHERAALGVLALGLLSFLGQLTGVPVLKGVGAASGVAPLPKVFSAHKGVETFAWDLTLVYDRDGLEERVPMTPERCASFSGPYNRRNVYGALLSYGPLLPDELRRAVAREAFSPQGRLRRELDVPADAENLRVELRSKTPGSPRSWVLTELECREVGAGAGGSS
ncbi:MAG: hypothetical protein JKY65_11905 [Planctomycetes bacterium]|nr:hypothetical protein [Planctomycetota bacterium]